MKQPIRIQRKRVKGWRKPEGVIYVGRGSKWGNPYRVDAFGREKAIEIFEFYLAHGQTMTGITAADVRRELRGKDLMCWCKTNEACHADVLLRVANEESE